MKKIILILILCSFLIGGAFFLGYKKYTSWNIDYQISPAEKEQDYAYQIEKKSQENQKNTEIYTQALGEKNPILCQSITQEEGKKKCESMIIAVQAKDTGNISLCDTIESESTTILCRDAIRLDRAMGTSNKILCQKISDANQKTTCEEIIDETVLRNAIGQRSVTESFCETLGEKHKTLCLAEIRDKSDTEKYETALAANDATICEKIVSFQKKNECLDTIYIKQAVSKQNEQICKSISTIEKQSYCLGQVGKKNDVTLYKEAQENKNLTTCEGIGAESLKNKCHDSILLMQVQETKNIALCEGLTATGMIETCKSIQP